MSETASEVARRQRPLRARYRDDPAEAITVKRVRTVQESARDPLHGAVESVSGHFPVTRWDFGTDSKVGGDDDLPNPGHVLCAALAACGDNSIRMVADHLGVTILNLSVEVTGDVDTRGCLAMDPSVRVGFLSLDMRVTLSVAPGTDPELVRLLRETSERLCVNLDTLKRGVPVTVTYPPAGPPVPGPGETSATSP